MRIAAVVALLVLPAAAAADIPGLSPEHTPEENGLAIAEEADRRGDGFGDSQSALQMLLFDGRGNSVTRSMRSKALEGDNGYDRTLLFFEDPADVRGTAFLTHGQEDVDQQWLYLPATKRVKRISSRNRSGAFMSSEFSYEDLGNDSIDKYRYKLLGAEAVEGIDCFRIERIPTGDSGYSRQEAWLDKAHLRVIRIDYFDRSGALLKTLTASDYERFVDRYWRPLRMAMINHQTGRKSILEWTDYEFSVGLAERDFSPESLRDIR